ncbi:GntR family transcriptional regulator [Brevundimonas sp. UBA2416]|uniref:GntR family transcriptional regulator n=1 Tax=Brevundimonas sp. UBA2416 TaxID=1946124 RepID=UPI0025BF4B4B|nr:GntR family transcriptional regulator [Brevundimonas sp. UBA2416]HRJ64492.1 GntR family transcriptional regulator [Brevundimonas sp.]
MTTRAPRLLPDQVFTEARERILSGRLPADAPIRQDALALELGVSKIPLREALARLESEGLVVSHPNRGFIVRPLSRADAEDVFDLRLRIEPIACVLGALEADAAAHEAARSAFAALDAALKNGLADVGRRNREFHLALVRPSGRAVTIETVDRLLALSERYVRVHLGEHRRLDRASHEHEALLQAWLERRTETVRREARAHIRATLVDLRAQLPEV